MDKEQQAIKRIQTASEMSFKLTGEPLLFTDSGGKDSAVICKLAENAHIPFEIVHSHTTADAPETVMHVRERAKQYEANGIKYTIDYPFYKGKPVSMWSLIPQKVMPPTRPVRYCCDVLKEHSMPGKVIVTGVRWAESAKRANTRNVYEIQSKDKEKRVFAGDNAENRTLFESCYQTGKRVVNPIIDWQDNDVWDYIADQKIKVNPLYYSGFCRVGCIGCPMAGKHRYEEFARYPKYMNLYINSFARMLDKRREKGMKVVWFTAEDVFHWWMEDGIMSGQVKIDEVEEANGNNNT